TFDTDTFEPQPDGVGTIFPFWVPRPAAPTLNDQTSPRPCNGNGSGSTPFIHQSIDPSIQSSGNGYVELPYTLPQDSTLFLLLRERTPDIWFQKLDWIAKHGGMALLDVHPDYMRFDGDPESPRT